MLDEENRKARAIVFIPNKSKIDNDINWVVENFIELCEIASVYTSIEFDEIIGESKDGKQYVIKETSIRKITDEIKLDVRKEDPVLKVTEELKVIYE